MGPSLRKLFKKESSTEEEIKQLVEGDEQVGELDENQRDMIYNIFEFDDLNAGDIMTHRTDIDAVDINDSIEDVVNISIKEGRSRIPVYKDDLDNICGIIYVKDLLKFVGEKITDDDKIADYIREPMFVPETIACGKLFAQMTEARTMMAIVVDEYGGTAGLVTMEDILEEIVGDIYDEYDPIEEKYEKIDENTFVVDGQISIYDFEKLVGVKDIETECDTLSGYLMELMDRVPTEEENPVIETDKLVFKIEEFDERRIAKVKVCKINASKKENDEDEEQG